MVLEQPCLKLKHPDLGDVFQSPAVAQKLCVRPRVLNSPKSGSWYLFRAWTHHGGGHHEQEWEAEIAATQLSLSKVRPQKGQCLGVGPRAKAGRVGDLGKWLCGHGYF